MSSGLVGRLLYRIRSLSEQSPFEAETFSLFWPLLSQIVRKGGIDLSSEDDMVEQLTLALEIVRSHALQRMPQIEHSVGYLIHL